MSVYVGIDVHRKRSQVAVVTEDGTVELNKNVVNGSEPMPRLIGDLPAGTPAASGAAFGWGWLAGLLEEYGFDAHLVHPLRCKAIASARLKNDKGRRRHLGAAAARGPAARGAGSPRSRSASSARCCGTGSAAAGPDGLPAAGERGGGQAEEHRDCREVMDHAGAAGLGERVGCSWRVAADRVGNEDG
jgi:hypothetical protein